MNMERKEIEKQNNLDDLSVDITDGLCFSKLTDLSVVWALSITAINNSYKLW